MDCGESRRRREQDGTAEDGVKPVEVVEGSKHGDGSIYRPDAHPLHKLYRLDDTRETRLEPMRLSAPTPDCHPCWTACRQHLGCAMLQIFSLELVRLPAAASGAGPVELYGFIAVRDLLDPLRNYVFHRPRDDPLVIRDPRADPFIYLSGGPRRGVYLQCRALLEYDVRVKRGRREQDDLPLIDGAATFSELTCAHGVLTNRIHGDSGAAVDISRALFRDAVEATVEAWVTKLPAAGGVDLSMTGLVGEIAREIRLFRGLVGEPRALGRFVVAVRLGSYLFLHMEGAGQPAGKFDWFAFRATSHGCSSDRRKLGFATVEIKVTWSSLC